MGEDFEAPICGDNWWSSSRNMFVAVGVNDLTWPPADDFLDTKPKSAIDSGHNNNNNMLFQDYSTFHNMGFAHWTQSDDFMGGRGESNFNNSNGLMDQIKNPTNLSCDFSSINGFKQGADHVDFNLLEQNNHLNSTTSSKGLFAIDSTLLYGYPSTKLLQPQHSLFNPTPPINTNSTLIPTNLNNLSLSNSTPNFASNYIKPSLPKSPHPHPIPSALHFTNNTPFWNAPKSQITNKSLPNFKAIKSGNCEEQIKKGDKNSGATESVPMFKRPRIETPSPLPTFKVRKEKLGDRVTALQQLVSPFGKTDTASVLHEAIEYIKFLHDQVSVLSTPYMKGNNGITPIQHQQVTEKTDRDCPKQDLRSRGLCLVPISSTFPVTNTATADFWTPAALGGAFR